MTIARLYLSLLLWAASFVITACLGFSASADFLEKAEHIASRAPSLGAFLSDQNLLNEYSIVLTKHYGADRFPRESFDAILVQLNVCRRRLSLLGIKQPA